ncbi:MAG TPA: sigma-70 family RNA polymerase sigma factor [Nitriliruptorales bacterium]|jgi:RNA polymerase sigma-70 factor (ECF subfamily)
MGRTGADGLLDGMTMAELHQRFAGPLLVFANRSVGDAELAREIVNDTLLRAWRHAHRFDPERGELATWLFTIARNLSIDAGRRRLARPTITRDVEDLEVVEDSDVDRILEAWEIADALRSLQPAHRAVIIEVHYRGASIAEAAERLGIPQGTVKSRLYYGLRGLRLALEERGVMG